MHALNNAELLLLAWTVSGLWRFLRSRLRVGTTLLARPAKQHLVTERELVFEFDQQLHLLDAVALYRAELLLQLEHFAKQTLVFAFKQPRCSANLLFIHVVDAKRHTRALPGLDRRSRIERVALRELRAQVRLREQ